jgi:hypothetical protein
MSNYFNLEYYLHRHLNNALSDEEKLQLAEALDDPANMEKFILLIEGLYSKETAKDFV